ncbi:MAG TPA: Hsp20/alpha crystallin family protein [Methanobacteriaceae archaeon]|nr:Hsp20/alpha crystallin family protein [Methanobacteriaceae archaeon]
MMRRRNVAEQMFSDMVDTIKEKQEELEKAIADYKSNTLVKLSMDMSEDDENITVVTDLPGVNKENIKIDITEDTLTIQAQFTEETEEEGEEDGVKYHKKERSYGEASRTLVLPAKIKMDEAAAKFDNGVLTVLLPKLEQKEVFEVKVD